MFIFVILLIPWIIVIIFQFIDPGSITKNNVDNYLKVYLDQQQQKHIKLNRCAYLYIPAVPRSRFCSFSQKRIAKFDHFCPWVIQPIGEKNIRFYLLFLLLIYQVSYVWL